jgi:folate-binding protein YgfZ
MTDQSPSPVPLIPGANEARAARESAVWFELPGRTHLEITGADRAKFLHNFCTNDIKGLVTGSGCEAFVTSVQGKILGHVLVFAEDDRLTVSAVPGCADRLVRHLSKYQINEAVTFTDQTAAWSTGFIVGPNAPRVVERVVGGPLPREDLRHVSFGVGPSRVRVRRYDLLGFPGYELVVENAGWQRLREALPELAVAGSVALLQYLRISAGVPWYGVDLTDANLAQEASRTSRAIHFRKGCYLGQEPIARIDAMGHVNQQLRSVKIEGGEIPSAGTELFHPQEPTKSVGRITSAVGLPDAPGAVCLAFLKRGCESPGQRVLVGESRRPAEVFWNGPS